MTGPSLRDALTGPRDWMTQAKCASRTYDGFTELAVVDQTAICTGYGDPAHACPVQVECLAYALQTHGVEEMSACQGLVYGGTVLPDARGAVRNAAKRAARAARAEQVA